MFYKSKCSTSKLKGGKELKKQIQYKIAKNWGIGFNLYE